MGDCKTILFNVTIRREMGRDIDAACGQLRNKERGGNDDESICKD
ncbi:MULTISPECIES: hypothetical protein [Clostridia]|nr:MULTISPECIES: hypothetical protein [Clostridia]